ncbi:MAG: response regulator transcription factor, partial [Chloroflexi bacterium]|nr:response regulator transcription factor [Chloroflexota bacterium]
MTDSTKPVRVILADDHAVVRKGIREFLEMSGNVTVLAEAAEGAEALRLIREHKPDVAVLDIQMPNQTGIEVTRAIRTERLPIGVLILT